MRWGANRASWVRPLHGVVALLDGRVLEGAIELGAGRIAFGDRTHGHRFLAPAAFAVAGFADYRDRLRQAFVVLDPAERRAEVERQAKAVAAAQGLVLKDDPGLLDEVVVSIAPVTLGAGRPLLDGHVELELRDSGVNGELLCARYAVVGADVVG